MTDMEEWNKWLEDNAKVITSDVLGEKILYYDGADRKKAFLDGLHRGDELHRQLFRDMELEIDILNRMITRVCDSPKNLRTEVIDEMSKEST